jgi:hypothetical protein
VGALVTRPILLLGARGSMGRRYQAILRHLGVPFTPLDVETTPTDALEHAARSRGVILATPTATHGDYLRLLADLDDVPMLCEKPITQDLAELDALLGRRGPLSMMMQYEMLNDPRGAGPTRYDYFRHGSDGLGWDCMQLLGLARGAVTLADTSPVWTCSLNGARLSLGMVERAYVKEVAFWLEHPEGDRALIARMHAKAAEWTAEHGAKCYNA